MSEDLYDSRFHYRGTPILENKLVSAEESTSRIYGSVSEEIPVVLVLMMSFRSNRGNQSRIQKVI